MSLSKPRVVFLGTPEFAVPAFEALVDAAEVVLVVTQPDRRAGRGLKMQPPPVKEAALRHQIEVVQPDRVKGRQFADFVASYQPDFLVTAAFGRILGKRILDVPKVDALNVHASLLPRYRGAAPINYALLAGDETTGVSIMRMELGLDSGPVFHRAKLAIEPNETTGELTLRLAQLGATAVVKVISDYESYVPPTPQDEASVTWSPMMEKSQGKIDWTRTAREIHNQVRGFHPWPCAFCRQGDDVVKLHRTVLHDGSQDVFASPGTVLAAGAEGIDVACGSGILRILELQAPGRKRLPAAQFLAGHSLEKEMTLS